MISILILTLDEEINLPACLKSLAWSDDIVVLDSGSSDRTIEIAKAAGARVISRKLDTWSGQLNWAVENIDFKHSWVYNSDADEVMTDELREEILRIAGDPSRSEVAYRVRFQNMFLGRWIRRCSLYPTWILRFFKPAKVRWKRIVNPIPDIDGPEGKLNGHFLHYSFNKGLTAWFEKHNRYSLQEAQEALRVRKGGGAPLSALFSRDPARRRAALKDLSFRLPARPLLRFFYLYLLRLGFLEGSAGLTYCRLMAVYEYMIDLKMRELERRGRGLSV